MFIIPVSSIPELQAIGEARPVAPQQPSMHNLPFADVLADAMKTVEQTKAVADQGSYALALGETDDLHNIQIDALKASTAVDMAVGLATKAISSYTEIMRMNI